MVGLFSAGRIFSIESRASFWIFIFKPTLLRASIAAFSSMEIFSIFSFLNLSCQACLFAINLVVEVITVSIIRRLFASSDVPVSVNSTIASTSRAFTSVAPQLNSTLTLIFLSAKYFFVTLTSSVATMPPERSLGLVTFDSSGTASTHLAGSLVALL